MRNIQVLFSRMHLDLRQHKKQQSLSRRSHLPIPVNHTMQNPQPHLKPELHLQSSKDHPSENPKPTKDCNHTSHTPWHILQYKEHLLASFTPTTTSNHMTDTPILESHAIDYHHTLHKSHYSHLNTYTKHITTSSTIPSRPQALHSQPNLNTEKSFTVHIYHSGPSIPLFLTFPLFLS